MCRRAFCLPLLYGYIGSCPKFWDDDDDDDDDENMEYVNGSWSEPCTVHYPYSTIRIQKCRLVHGSSKTSPTTRVLYRTKQSQGSCPTRRCGSSHLQAPALIGLGKPIPAGILVTGKRYPEMGYVLYGHPDISTSAQEDVFAQDGDHFAG